MNTTRMEAFSDGVITITRDARRAPNVVDGSVAGAAVRSYMIPAARRRSMSCADNPNR